ncbi:plasma-membrane choline transporter-domain-containing protein [Mycena albidolilacea]|uniref:Protein PNS1 n=1 Tax=Mycena albidolilacea TaxID=1033008 RepID=A0AAD6ZZU5_9AGAR|nr:plasma-membrane choline transporter-domain-containing protein [Mycena albidolilacea]
MSQWPQQQQYQPGPTPQYAPQYAPTQYAPPPEPFYNDTKSPYENDRFKPKKRINDPIFLILFVLQFLGFVAVSGIAISQWVKSGGLGGGLGKTHTGTSVSLNQSTVYLLLLVTAAALLLSTIYLLLVRAFTKTIMHITLILNILMNIAICVYYWLTKYYSGAIIFTVIALFSVLSYYGFRSRIPLASLLLQVVIDVSKHHKSVYVVAFSALILQALLAVWYTFASIATYAKWTPGNPSCETSGCSSGKVAGLIFFLTFSFLWTSQVIGNVALATLAGGPYGCWYYFGPRGEGDMPKRPTLSALGRASTLSLGSIAFGSLIVTVLEMLKMVLHAVQSSANADGHPVEACLACCASCFVGIIESLVQYFNRYAYIEIALYGKPYISAAKDTWNLLVDRGVSAVVNDSLVGMTLTWGAYGVGLLSSLFAYLYLRLTAPSYNADGNYTAPVILFAFLIGLQCSLTLSSAIEAGVSTIFVGLGEDPQVLAIRAPALFGLIAQTYPDVVRGVV